MHIAVYHLLAQAFFTIDAPALPGIVYSYALWALGMLALVPLCGRYHALRKRYPEGVLSFL